MDRIVPADEYLGAWAAGVGDYLARQFAGDLCESVDTYRAGLDALEAEAIASAGVGFAALPEDEQDALLRRVEAGEVTGPWPVEPAAFFSMVVEHVIEGYYSDPGNGGNREGAAWQMIGFVAGTRPDGQP